MTANPPLRVMWLLNHTSARKFEVAMLKRMGVTQIFLPKIFPADPSFRSASVDYSEDCNLDIAAADLQVLNAADWYRGASPQAWSIANQHFDLAFIILHYPEVFEKAAQHFSGAVLWRAYGLVQSASYGHLAKLFQQIQNLQRIRQRFYFAEAYANLGDAEPELLKSRRLYLPLGLEDPFVRGNWNGDAKHVYFVCPDIGFNPYYQKIYRAFVKDFSGIHYVIAGAQPIQVHDPKVLGFVSGAQHALNMAQSRVMFYHSREPNHIHYHPFEAIRAGMPLVFMAGGMLDRLGGQGLPGRCVSVAEARSKVERLLADDQDLIGRIRASQAVLLEAMRPENCEPAWRQGLARIAGELQAWRAEQAARPPQTQRRRIAVVLPVGYRGGSLRGALALAQALHLGSRQCAEDADIVLLHLDDGTTYPEDAFADWPPTIGRRAFKWKTLGAAEARRAMRYAGYADWEPTHAHYMAPDDGMAQLLDCGLWLFISDRLQHPVLPLRPLVLMVYDYLQRYQDLLPRGTDQPYLLAARGATRVLVSTEFARRDALQYAGIDPRKVGKLPMLAPDFPILPRANEVRDDKDRTRPYFLWTTNAAPHKNHLHAAEALLIYYEELGGQWACRVTGVNTGGMLTSKLPHLRAMADVFARSKALRKAVQWLGELPDAAYRQRLGGAGFLWHAARIDNGTFAVIEAACMGVPALSSDYPAMREIDTQFALHLAWMDADSPRQMAQQLKHMEQHAAAQQRKLPTAQQLQAQRLETHATAYWQEVRACL